MALQTKNTIKITIIISIILILAWVWIFVEKQQEFLEISFFDVGQGDAILIETPNKKQILVDGGPDSTILEKLGKELPFWDRYIDLIILTHPEYDHMGGLIEVIKRYKIGGILTTGVIRNTAEYKEWQNIINKENIPILIAQASRIINLDDNIDLVILYPFENLAGQIIKKANNASIVAQLIYKDFELLLTGDIEKKIEKELLKNLPTDRLRSDSLKIPHHGSKTSTTKEFINAVNPILAVIQAGKDNSYGHPHNSVLNTLSNITTLITAEHGDIKILTTGTKFHVQY